jgi:exodeoxyribonuclease V beta subunit
MREIRFSDICILMNSNAQNAAMARTLIAQGVPATLYGGANVFSSEAAIQWRHLLFALQRPTSTSAICLFAWTWFGGASVAEVMAGHDNEEWLAHHQDRLLSLHDAFGRMKRSAFFDFVMKDTGVLPFLARMENSQRTITDTQHVAEILRLRQNESLSQ